MYWPSKDKSFAKVLVEIDISQDAMFSHLNTAYEQGSTWIDHIYLQKDKKVKGNKALIALVEKGDDVVIVTDGHGIDKEYLLTTEKLRLAVGKYLHHIGNRFVNPSVEVIMNEEPMDATEADVFLQYAIFGEVIMD